MNRLDFVLGPEFDAAARLNLEALAKAAGFDVGDPQGRPTDEAGDPSHRGPDAADILIVDAPCAIDAGTLIELRRVADTDPMLVGVMPRFVTSDAERAVYMGFPDVTYAIVPDVRCLYAKGSILRSFGSLPATGAISEPAEPDRLGRLMMLNRLGFRVAMANRAFARPRDEGSRRPVATVPTEWHSALANRLSSASAEAERLMRGLRPDAAGRLRLAFDLSHVGPDHSGTTVLASALIREAASRWRDCAIHVIAGAPAFASHCGGLGGSVTRVDPADPSVFAAVIRIGQPFLWKEIESVVRRAPVLVLFMLDTIGLDCLSHAPDELDALWRFALNEADGLLFNSAFTERQFARRFTIRSDLPRRVSLHSLDAADYRDAGATPSSAAPGGAGPVGAIVLIGNAFPHKYLAETATILARAGLAAPIVALGLAVDAVVGVTCIPSGTLDRRRLAALLAASSLVVYPSVYEGFGFPILEAIAYRKPILVRPLPPYAEIAAGLPEAGNIHVFLDDADLVRRLREGLTWTDHRSVVSVRGWADAAADLRAVLDEACAEVSYDRVVRRLDMLRGRMAYLRSKSFAPDRRDGEAAGDEVERLAGAAGRMAQATVARLARRLPGAAPVLRFADRMIQRRRSP